MSHLEKGLQAGGFGDLALLDVLQASDPGVGSVRRSLGAPCRVAQEAVPV